MITYSTCLGCGEPMIVTDELVYQSGRRTHDSCPGRPAPIDTLCEQFAAAVIAGDGARAYELEAQIAAMQSSPPRLRDAALLYASWGWPVFPLAPLSKVPAIKGGHGVHDASTNHSRIANHWAAHPDHNIGLACGYAFDVIDIDRAGGGIDTYHRWLNMVGPDGRGPLPDCHGRVVTANAGLHIYTEPWGEGQRNAVRLAQGIDMRTRGGYVVAPPSTLGDHKSWNWLTHPSPMIKNPPARPDHSPTSS